MAHRPGPDAPQGARGAKDDSGDWPVDQGRSLALRLLALVGALAFVMLGINSLLPVLRPPAPPPPLPGQRDALA